MEPASVRNVILAAAFLTATPAAAPAQDPAADLTLPGAVLERDLGRDQPVTVLLSTRFIYTALVDVPGADLSLRTTGPRPVRGLAARVAGPEGGTRFEVYAAEDGEHLVEIFGLGSRARIRLRLEVDSAATIAREKRDAAPRITVGVEMAAGGHTGYSPWTPDSGEGGAGIVEFCLSIRHGHRLGGCLGYSREAIPGLDQAFDFYFGEFRLTALGSPEARVPLTAGVAVRIGQGSLSGAGQTVDPSLRSAGIWVAWWPVAASTGRGLMIRTSAAWARYGNLRPQALVPVGSTASRSDDAFRFLVGVNWHP